MERRAQTDGTFLPGHAGRPPGTPDKVPREVRELARQYTEDAVEELAAIAFESDSDFARVAAIKELLDRGWGKSKASVEVSGKVEHEHTDARDRLKHLIDGHAKTVRVIDAVPVEPQELPVERD